MHLGVNVTDHLNNANESILLEIMAAVAYEVFIPILHFEENSNNDSLAFTFVKEESKGSNV